MNSSDITLVLDELCKRFGVIVDWSSANVMPYIEDFSRRLIMYEIKISIMLICIFVVLSVVFVAVAIKSFHHRKALKESNFDEWIFISTFIAAIVVFISMLVITKQAIDLIACSCFPEKIILAYITELT